jgi:hypothetical protein
VENSCHCHSAKRVHYFYDVVRGPSTFGRGTSYRTTHDRISSPHCDATPVRYGTESHADDRALGEIACIFDLSLVAYFVQTFTTPGDASPKTPRRRRKPYPHKNDLLKLYTTDVAEQLTLFEFKLYARVTPQECIRHTTTPSTRSDSDLFVFCSTHDKLAAWVKTSILNRTALGKRADTVDFWIKIAEVSDIC